MILNPKAIGNVPHEGKDCDFNPADGLTALEVIILKKLAEKEKDEAS